MFLHSYMHWYQCNSGVARYQINICKSCFYICTEKKCIISMKNSYEHDIIYKNEEYQIEIV